VLKNKKIAVLGIFFLFVANVAQAFEQDYTPKDAALKYQTYLNMINIGPSWSNELESNKEVVVAVLDSGMDLDHPDLAANIWINTDEIASDSLDNDANSYIDDVLGWDFVASDNDPSPDLSEGYDYAAANHGTVIAGIISAAQNDNGITGIAPHAKIMPLRVLDKKGSGNTLVLSQAIEYAIENGADIINFSLVGEFYDEPLQKAIKKAYDNGIMIVAASGNEEEEGLSLDIDPRYPVCDIDGINRVMGVAALDKDKKLSKFSNYGEACIDISAPGEDFYSSTYYDQDKTDFRTYYKGGWNGTSVAAPTVTATMALIKMQYPDLRPYDIYNIVMASSQDLSEANPLHHVDLGAGLLDVGAAINYAHDYYHESIKIILSPQAGQAPQVLIMDTDGNVIDTFLAYMSAFTGGVNVATGDVDGDGKEEIITAPMAGGGPHIRIFDQDGNLLSEFFAYEAQFTGGVNVATGDVNNDSKEEIVVAPYSKYEPRVRIYDEYGGSKGSFLAYENGATNGVSVSVADVNNDGWPEIVTVPAKDYGPEVKMFSLKGRIKDEFLAYSKYLYSGVSVVAKDISGDALPEILLLPKKGSAALLKSYDETGIEKKSLYLRDTKDKNGYNFAILAR